MTGEMTGATPWQVSSRARRRSPRAHPWRRRILLGVVVLVALAVVAVGLVVKLAPTPAVLALPTTPAGTPVGALQGTWSVSAGSVAGYRVQETFFGLSNFAVGRTTAVAGTLGIAGNEVVSAVFRIDLAALTASGKRQPQVASSLETAVYPDATFRLTEPMTLSIGFSSGKTMTATATGDLAMRGISRPVSLTISGRRDGEVLQAVGSIPVVFADWGIKGPAGFGWFGSLADHGVAEFSVVLRRQ
ncbi:MAG: YceI family protein [Acidimicrobiales bacterium]